MAVLEENKYNDEMNQLILESIMYIVAPEASDSADVVMEVKAGIGGQESMLFTEELLEMYKNVSSLKNWDFEISEHSPSELGGLRLCTAFVSGDNVYKYLKYEAGIHRVQRVPKTERSGRMHTSTAAVAVYPQPKEINVNLNSSDLKMEAKRSSGAGGQHVNTTDSCVRITHLPTGIVVECQRERSQIKNRQLALKILQAKLYKMQLDEQEKEIQSTRKQQFKNSERSDKIRTYNFHKNRVVDHRVGFTSNDVRSFMEGGQAFQSLLETLIETEYRARLLEIIQS